MSHVLVNVAWPYANGPRHIGHVAGFGVPSDVYARYERMKGNDVLMVSGTDEHGTPILVEAEKEGLTAQELANRYNRVIAKDLCDLGLSYDLFTRTTTGNHEHVVQEMFKQCLENGYIYKGTQQVAISPPKVRVATSATPAATSSTRTSSSTPSPRLTAKPRASSRPSTTSSTCRRSPKPTRRGWRPARAGVPTSSTSRSACSRKLSRAPSPVTSTGVSRCR